MQLTAYCIKVFVVMVAGAQLLCGVQAMTSANRSTFDHNIVVSDDPQSQTTRPGNRSLFKRLRPLVAYDKRMDTVEEDGTSAQPILLTVGMVLIAVAVLVAAVVAVVVSERRANRRLRRAAARVRDAAIQQPLMFDDNMNSARSQQSSSRTPTSTSTDVTLAQQHDAEPQPLISSGKPDSPWVDITLTDSATASSPSTVADPGVSHTSCSSIH
jgi:type II secretory pathway pseudopilin PulG